MNAPKRALAMLGTIAPALECETNGVYFPLALATSRSAKNRTLGQL